MDEQTVAGVDRFRSMLLRALVLIGGVLAGTALAWLLSAATASAAEPTAPVTDLLSTAGSVVDNSVQHTVHLGQDAGLAAQALPAAAPAVPALQVPVPHLVAPVILVEQRLSEIAQPQQLDEPVHTAVTRTYVPAVGSPAAHRTGPVPAVSRDVPQSAALVVAHPQAAMGAPSAPLHRDDSPRSEAIPFGSLPGSVTGHDGPAGSGGVCLGDGVTAVPAAASVPPAQSRSRCVPMTARRQPGITPD